MSPWRGRDKIQKWINVPTERNEDRVPVITFWKILWDNTYRMGIVLDCRTCGSVRKAILKTHNGVYVSLLRNSFNKRSPKYKSKRPITKDVTTFIDAHHNEVNMFTHKEIPNYPSSHLLPFLTYSTNNSLFYYKNTIRSGTYSSSRRYACYRNLGPSDVTQIRKSLSNSLGRGPRRTAPPWGPFLSKEER